MLRAAVERENAKKKKRCRPRRFILNKEAHVQSEEVHVQNEEMDVRKEEVWS